MISGIAREPVLPELAAYAATAADRIALIDSNGSIVSVNSNWMAFAQENGAALHRAGPGANYLEICRRANNSPDARAALAGIKAVLKGKLPSFTMGYVYDSAAERRYFRMCVSPMRYEEARFVVGHTDITELQVAKEKSLNELRGFARRLINVQEQERERMAREIHDDLGSRVALLSFSVRRLMNKREPRSSSFAAELDQVISNIAELSNTLRSLSRCLYPPSLQHAGLGVALRALCEEFEQVYGVDTHTSVSEEAASLPEETALSIFRILQECLHNIAKHAQARSVRVVFQYKPRCVRLTVSDDGRGFLPAESFGTGGLGLLSMKERVLCLSGSLEIRSAPGQGTSVRVTVPMP